MVKIMFGKGDGGDTVPEREVGDAGEGVEDVAP